MKGFIRILGSITVHEGQHSNLTIEVSLESGDASEVGDLIEQLLAGSHESATLQDSGRSALKIAIGPTSRIRSRSGIRLEVDLDRVAAEYLCLLLGRLAEDREVMRWLHADIELDGGSVLMVRSAMFGR